MCLIKLYLLLLVTIYSCETIYGRSFQPNSLKGLNETSCAGEGWIPYQDQKCFKLIQTYGNQSNAETLCLDEALDDELFYPSLATIKVAEEQDFVTALLFEALQEEATIWLGLVRQEDGEFRWNDRSELEFTNWGPGSPTNSSTGRNCVELQLLYNLVKQDGVVVQNAGIISNWRDVSCSKGNYILCEKTQAWGMSDLIRLVIELRTKQNDLSQLVSELRTKQNETQTSVGDLNRSVSELRTKQNETQTSVGDLSRSVSELRTKQNEMQTSIGNLNQKMVPVGSIYTRQGHNAHPSTIWPGTSWTKTGDCGCSCWGAFPQCYCSVNCEFLQRTA